MPNPTERDPSLCPHGILLCNCKEQECIEEMIRIEDAAYCEHGYLAGCQACGAAASMVGV